MGMLEELRKQAASNARRTSGNLEVPTGVRVHSPGLCSHIDHNIIVSQKDRFDAFDSTAHLRPILLKLEPDKELRRVVILGSGEGGWAKLVAENFKTDWIHSYLWWKNHERPALAFHDEKVTVMTEDIGSVHPYGCCTLLCNMLPVSLQQELANLEVLARWLETWPKLFVIRIVHYEEEAIKSKLKEYQRRFGYGRLVAIVKSEGGPVLGVYFTSGRPDRSIDDDLRAVKSAALIAGSIQHEETAINGKWPIPDELPVEQLAPLDMGQTLKHYGDLCAPEGGRNFLKELGWIPINYKPQNNTYRSEIIMQLIQPLLPLFDDHEKWILTANDPIHLEQTIDEKIDYPPKENHQHHEHLWAAYRAIAQYLIKKGCKIQRLTYEEVELYANKQSYMGWQERDLECSNVGEYLNLSDVWRTNVEEFRRHLLAGRPMKGDYNSSGKREPKREHRTRFIWSLCATARLYEAQVLGAADDLLKELPYTVIDTPAQDFGEIFKELLNHPDERRAVCDDIKGWDTKISYSLLCMEAAFLQLLAEDDDHRYEIKQLYRLYAFGVVNVKELYEDSQNNQRCRKVFYQLQGQVASGRRVTYCMNTITNIVITMTRAAVSQKVKLKDMEEWITECLELGHSHRYGGKLSGDDTVIILGKKEAKLFATIGAEFMNDLGLIRKQTGTGVSRVVEDLSEIDFCSRKFVDVPMYSRGEFAFNRLLPIRKVEEIIMRRLLREEKPSYEYELAWVREQGKNWLKDYFHSPTMRILAKAVLSATPNNVAIDGDNEERWHYTTEPQIGKYGLIDEMSKHYFGKGTKFRKRYRARNFNDFGFLSNVDCKLYDLDTCSYHYKNWKAKLPVIIRKLQEPDKPYDDWFREEEVQPEPRTKPPQTVFYLIVLFVLAFLVYRAYCSARGK